jgi:cytochrome c oxidase subunit II
VHARSDRRRRWWVALTATLVLVATGCADDAPQDALKPEGEWSRKTDRLWDLTFAIATVVFVLVTAALVIAMVKFRRRSDDDRPKQTHGNIKLEIGWTILPALVLAVIAFPTVATIFDLADDPAPDALHVEVVGHQFWWEYRYYEGDQTDGLDDADLLFATANELVIPADREVALHVTSIDVIHSFWTPRLAGKQDAIPGRTTLLKIEADDPGQRFLGQCAEFCSLSHANMRLVTVTLTEDEYQDWEQAQLEPFDPSTLEGNAAAQAGYDHFIDPNIGCAGCHTIGGVQEAAGVVGPNLTHLQDRETFAGSYLEMNTENLTAWVYDAPGVKPGVFMPAFNGDNPNFPELTGQQVDELVAFLETLGAEQP